MEQTIALLIDFENIAAGTEKEGLGRFDISKVIARVKDKGRILIARSYADWGRFARFKQSLLTHNVTMYELTSHGMQDKNRADIAMVVDCLELAYTRDYVDTYVVVSGDSDFTPLVLKLKELNKRVIGIGTRRSTSRLIINACDEFIFYDSIVQKKKKPRKSSGSVPKDREKAFELLSDVLDGMQREDPTPPHASVLKSAMLRRQPDFNENDLGFGSFTRFLEAARDASYVLLSRDKKSGGYTVDSVDDPEEGDDSPAPRKAAAKSKGGAYDDPYFPEGVEDYVKRINEAGYCALSHPTRMAVLDELTSAVAERKKKRRRVNIPFMQEDLLKRLRNTHPDLSGDHLRDVMKGLLKAGLLMHRDGSPIRSQNASFELKDDAGKLNKGLVEFYLRTLSEDDADLSDVDTLAELFFGDADRRRDVETIIAWMAAPAEPSDLDDLLEVEDDADDTSDDDTSDTGGDDDLDDLDALLVADEPAEEKPAPKKKRSRSRKKTPAKTETADAKADDEPKADDDAKVEEAAPAEEAKAPAKKAPAKKKTTARKSTAKKTTAKKEEAPAEAEVDTPVEAIAEAAEEPAEEAKPKRTTRRRTKKATDEKKEKDAEVDASVEADDA